MILLSATLLGVVRHDPRERVVLPERVVLAASSGALQTLDLELSWDPRLAFAHGAPPFAHISPRSTSAHTHRANSARRPRPADAEGYQLLHHAADKVRPEICRLLLARGADVDARTADTGLTPLIFAVNRLDVGLVETFIEAGADLDMQDKVLGASALMIAADGGHHALVERLLAGGARRGVLDKRGRQAIDYARENGHHDLAAFLDKGDSASYSTWFLTAAVLAASFAAARLPLAAAAPGAMLLARTRGRSVATAPRRGQRQRRRSAAAAAAAATAAAAAAGEEAVAGSGLSAVAVGRTGAGAAAAAAACSEAASVTGGQRRRHLHSALAWCARLVALRIARDAGAAVATEARSSGPAATSSHTSSSSSHAAASHAPAAESSSAAAGVGCLAHESAPAPEATLPLEAAPRAAAAHAVPLQQQQDEKQAASLQAVPPGAAADALQQPECIVCWDAPATHIFVPCGHQCVCERCGAKLERCPKCRVVPTAMMRVFH